MEEWRDVVGYEGLYQVSNRGNVRSLVKKTRRGIRLLKPCINSLGYCVVTLYKDKKQKVLRVHTLVAQAFSDICGEWFDGCEVDHLDTNKTNNEASNLSVGTREANANNKLTREHHKIIMTGRYGILNNNHKSIVQYNLYGDIIKEYNCIRDAERETHIKVTHISAVCRGKRKTAGGFKWKYKE